MSYGETPMSFDPRPRPYDSARITVALDGGFTFDVQDWEGDDERLSDGEAFAMADDLVRSGVELYGALSRPANPVKGLTATNARNGCTRLDPARIVAVLIEPTGTER
jgi:hypothetical protein